ncbi:MAG TPA: O-antigen ligase family protein [Solirubrobacteraceae bacterium]|nr:O-antigen ligase family protein [Solirubrobacteraceae bacterium]
MRVRNPFRLGATLFSSAGQAAVGAAIAALAGLAAASGQGSLLLVVGLALLGLAALWRWPALTVLALVVICQEIGPNDGFGRGGSALLFLGHQLYQTVSRISVFTLIEAVAFARVMLIEPPRRPHLPAALLVATMGLWYSATVWLDGSAVTSAINQDARYALLFLFAFGLGAWARGRVAWRRLLIPVMLGVFTALALIGSYLAATGQGQAQSGLNIIFYDTATGTAAGAVALAVVLAPSRVRDRRVWWLGGMALLVVILSSRRAVWAAMVVALLVGLMVGRNRARLILRGLSVLAGILITLAIFAPSVLSEIGRQLATVWGATQGSAADNSTQGHLSDVSVGIRAVLAHPVAGIGAGGHLPGLVVETPGPLYIHNQILESWLRFGIVAALLVVAVQVTLIRQAIVLLRRHADDLTVSWAALLLIMAPVAMLTAPFFTQNQRWPAMIGLAGGLVAARAAPAALSAPASEPGGPG